MAYQLQPDNVSLFRTAWWRPMHDTLINSQIIIYIYMPIYIYIYIYIYVYSERERERPKYAIIQMKVQKEFLLIDVLKILTISIFIRFFCL